MLFGRKAMTNLDSLVKSREFADKGLFSQSYGFSNGHIRMWELDHKEGWAATFFSAQPSLWSNSHILWYWKRLLIVSWTARRSNQSIKSTLTIHWKDWCWTSNTLATWWEETTHEKRPCFKRTRGATEDEMVRCYHWLNGHEFEET